MKTTEIRFRYGVDSPDVGDYDSPSSMDDGGRDGLWKVNRVISHNLIEIIFALNNTIFHILIIGITLYSTMVYLHW